MWRFAMVLALACGSPETELAREPAEQPRWEAHEWGLLGYEALSEDESVFVTASPILETTGLAADPGGGTGYAPVIYAQLLGGMHEVRFEAAVGVPASAILETWPLAPNARWQVRAHAGSACGAHYPSRSDPPCDSVADGFCEAMNAHHYEASDGACLEVGGQDYDHLLYRARVARNALPFDVVRENGRLVVRAAANAPSARLLRVRRSFAYRRTELVAFDAPAASTSMPLPEPERATDPGAALRDLYEELERAGLTAPESQAFAQAWSDAIVPEADEPRFPVVQRLRLAPEVRPVGDAVYYWLPRERADALLPLSFTPPPAAVRRALLVRISLEQLRVGSRSTVSGVRIANARGRGIAGEVVRRIAQRNLAPLRFCVERLGVAPPVRISVHAELLPTGSIERWSDVVTSDPPNEPLIECVVAAVRRWSFPPPTQADASIDFDFEGSR